MNIFSTYASSIPVFTAVAVTKLLCSAHIGDAKHAVATTFVPEVAEYGTFGHGPTWLFTATTTGTFETLDSPPVWVPKTALGKKLAEARAAVVASGTVLLSIDEINRKLMRSRFGT